MGKRTGPSYFCAAMAVGCVMSCFTATVVLSELPIVVKPAETNSPPSAITSGADAKDNKSAFINLALQSVQQLHDEQQSLLQALQQLRQESASSRQEADAASKRYSDVIAARLATIEQAVATQPGTNSAQQIQEQQALLLAIEQTRKETTATAAALDTARHDAEIAARKNAEAFEARLRELEGTVKQRAARELETMQNA